MLRISKKIVSILLFAFVLSISVLTIADNGNTIVYITETGKKYHSSSCGYLRQSKIEITLVNAVARGYTPCSRCNPPRLDSNTTKQQIPTGNSQSNIYTTKPTSKPQSKTNTVRPTSTVPSKTNITTNETGGSSSNAVSSNIYRGTDSSSRAKNTAETPSHFGFIVIGVIGFLIGRFIKRKR